MRSRKQFFRIRKALVLALGVLGISVSAALANPSMPGAVILVDKNTNQLHLAHYENGEYHIEKTYHVTLGRARGDKVVEGDLKTPEGIYFLTGEELPPKLPPLYGAMAFDVNYPNPVDRSEHKTGYGIMIHATNNPARLKKNLDSHGCIVIDNDEIRKLAPEITLGLTPVLIFNDLTKAYLQPGDDPKLHQFFQSWIHDWENKDLNGYISHYGSDFSADGKNLAQWRRYKESLNKRYAQIKISAEAVRYYKHPKYSVITFVENYQASRKNGGPPYHSFGTKILYVTRDADHLKILTEMFNPEIEPQLQRQLASQGNMTDHGTARNL